MVTLNKYITVLQLNFHSLDFLKLSINSSCIFFFVLSYPGSFGSQSYYWKNGANLSYLEAQPFPILCQLTCHRFLFTSCVSCDVSNIWTSGLYFNKFLINQTFFIYFLHTKINIIWNVHRLGGIEWLMLVVFHSGWHFFRKFCWPWLLMSWMGFTTELLFGWMIKVIMSFSFHNIYLIKLLFTNLKKSYEW